MPGWVEAFIVVAAVAIVIQTLIMLTMALAMRPVVIRFAQIASDFQVKMQPILATSTRILVDSEERIKSIMADTAEITQTARQEAQKVDRVVSESLDKLRVQIIRTDQLVTSALDATQEAGGRVRRTVLGPVNQISALLKGLKVGLDVIRGNRHAHPDGNVPQDEELFI
jgi:uncharacterized membrane-anchored protein YhcB (DUF1043 family)